MVLKNWKNVDLIRIRRSSLLEWARPDIETSDGGAEGRRFRGG